MEDGITTFVMTLDLLEVVAADIGIGDIGIGDIPTAAIIIIEE